MFGEWLPDLPPTDNPGLTEAKNVLPVDKFYRAYKPISGIGTALSARPRGGIGVLDTAGNAYVYVGTDVDLLVRNGTGWTDKSGATYTTAASGYWRFAQYDEFVIATNYADVPQTIEAGDAGNFSALATTGTAPYARQIGIVGRHVVLGDTNEATNGVVPYKIQWGRIDEPREWPTPGSADALSKQAGEQFMPAAFGAVRGIVGNDQFGIVFQKSGISRMTYVGGDVVYQFDVIDSTRGVEFPNATVQVGNSAYFISAEGICVTDGVSVTPIGVSRFDKFFLDAVDTGYPERVYGALDKRRNLIYWTYPGAGSSAGTPNRVLIYNYAENRATWAEDVATCILSGLTTGTTLDALDALFGSLDAVTPSLDDPYWQGGNALLIGFDSTYKMGAFTGTPGTAVIDGQEVELTPGLYTHVQGVRPIVQGNSSVTVSLGTRNNFGDSVTYTSPVSPTSRTGFADFRSESRLVRARVSVSGDFTAAQGLLYQALPSGAA